MKIGFIGLGTMGLPMAQNLMKAGYSLVIYNRNAVKARELAAKGTAVVAASPAQVAQQADIVFTILSDDAAVEEVYLGPEGLLGGCSSSKGKAALRIAVDSSTVSPDTSKKIAEAFAKAEVQTLDAPVTGSKPQAIEGILTFMVGGSPSAFEECLPLFQAMGKKAVRLGDNGAGSYAKLANNAISAIILAAVAEGLVMVQKSGVDPEQFLEVVAGGGARSGMAEIKGPKILDRNFEPQFMAKLMNKDLRLALRLADSLQIVTPVLSAVKQQFQIAVNSGYGEEDMSAVIKCYEQWADSEVKKMKS